MVYQPNALDRLGKKRRREISAAVLTTSFFGGLAMTRLQNDLILIAFAMLVGWASGCVPTAGQRPEGLSTVSEETQLLSGRHPAVSGAATVTTGTTAPHPQKDSPMKTEQVTGEMLEQAGATHVGQSLQDVPGVQPRR